MMQFAETALTDERFIQLYRLWQSKRRGDRLPGRQDFDPVEMPKLLKHLTLMDVEHAPVRIRIRLVGTAVVNAMGRDTTGHYMDELHGVDHVLDRMKHMVLTAQPYFAGDLPVTWTSRNHVSYSVLGLPLATDGQTVDKLIFMMIFT